MSLPMIDTSIHPGVGGEKYLKNMKSLAEILQALQLLGEEKTKMQEFYRWWISPRNKKKKKTHLNLPNKNTDGEE